MESFRAQRRAARVSTKTAAAKAFSSASGIWRPGARGLGSGLGWAGLGWAGLGWAGRALLGLAGAGLAGRLPSWAGLGCRLLWVGLGWTGLSWKIHCGQRIFKRQWFMASFRARHRVVGASAKTAAAAKAFSSASGIWRPLAGDAFPRKRAPFFEERRSPRTSGQEGPMERRGCARTFARPPLRSAVPPGLVARKGQRKEEAARGLLRALL